MDVPSDSSDSFVELIAQLRRGEPDAGAEVYARYAQRLIGLAQRQLADRLKPKVGAEDVVQSAFGSFFRRCQTAGWQFADRNSLWALLAEITYHKCHRVRRTFSAQARDVRREAAPSVTETNDGSWHLAGREPTPAEVAEVTDLVGRLLAELPDDERPIVQLRLEGYEVDEISERTGLSARTVFRRLQRLRARLERELEPSAG